VRIDELLVGARRLAADRGVDQVLAASEGLRLQVAADPAAPAPTRDRDPGSQPAAAGA
jgi:hypothetical protein